MAVIRSLLAVSTILGLALPGAAQLQRSFDSPFVTIRGGREAVSATMRPGGYALFDAAHRSLAPTRLRDLPLVEGRTVDVDLIPIDPWEAGGTAVIVGENGSRRLAPSLRLFRVVGPGADGFLGVSPDLVHGALVVEGETLVLSNGGDPNRPVLVARGHSVGVPNLSAWCRTATESIPAPGAGPGGLGVLGATASITKVRTSTVFVEVDKPLRDEFPSDQAAVDYVTLLVGVADAIYRRDLGVRITIPDGYLRVWNRRAPWKPLVPLSAARDLAAWWNSEDNPDSDLPRTQVHALTHVFNVQTGTHHWGFAFGLGVICRKPRSYAVSSIEGFTPFPLEHLSPDNGDLYLFTHESGHLFGSGHTHDYVPPIDCVDGSGPDEGTIMSYCYGPTGQSVAGIGMRFHPRVQLKIRNTMARANCIESVPIELGDYDADGILTPLDLAELDAYLAQGFVSRGARETFDMDGDNGVDGDDRDLLAAAVVPPASATVFNGSGKNRTAYESLAQPLLGTTWTGVVRDPDPWRLSLILATDARLPQPVATPFGELLVPLLGGQVTFLSLAPANATHAWAIPGDASLLGFTLETQAFVLGRGHLELVNGLQLVLGSYVI